MSETIFVNGKEYGIDKLLGKGKGGYSYLADCGGKKYVLKQIHHEPCAYYNFGNKLESEIRDYNRLRNIGVRMPVLLDVDYQNERILKEYIEGDTVYDLILGDRLQDGYVSQLHEMLELLYASGTNIDYFLQISSCKAASCII